MLQGNESFKPLYVTIVPVSYNNSEINTGETKSEKVKDLKLDSLLPQII